MPCRFVGLLRLPTNMRPLRCSKPRLRSSGRAPRPRRRAGRSRIVIRACSSAAAVPRMDLVDLRDCEHVIGLEAVLDLLVLGFGDFLAADAPGVLRLELEPTVVDVVLITTRRRCG